MLDCDDIRKDASPSLDSVTWQTAVPSKLSDILCVCTVGGLCIVMRQRSICMPDWVRL
jgi:hypothetical protein